MLDHKSVQQDYNLNYNLFEISSPGENGQLRLDDLHSHYNQQQRADDQHHQLQQGLQHGVREKVLPSQHLQRRLHQHRHRELRYTQTERERERSDRVNDLEINLKPMLLLILDGSCIERRPIMSLVQYR